MTVPTSPASETVFDRGAWLTLAAAGFLVLGGLAVFIWRLIVPTDGWWVIAAEGQEDAIVFSTNLMGAPSDLQFGDRLLAVEGIAFPQDNLMPAIPWQAGRLVRYTVDRGGVPVSLDVPLVHWNLAGLAHIAQVDPGTAASVLGDSLFLAIALLAFLKRPGNKAAKTLLTFAAFLVTSSAVTSILPRGFADFVDPFLSLGGFIFIIALFTILLPPTLLRFALVFPRPNPIIQRHPWLEYSPYLLGLILVPVFLFTNGLAGWLWTAGSTLASVGLMVYNNFTVRDAVSRAQLRWALGGMSAGLILILFGYPNDFGWVDGWLATLFQVFAGLGTVVMGISLSVAVLRYRLWDIDLIIRRTLVYAVLTAVLALVYFGTVAVLQNLVTAVSGRPSAVVVVASTLAIAALFAPLRRRVQNFIDRRFYRRKYDAAQTLAAFAAAARDETDLAALAGRLEVVVRETVQPAHVDLWLKPAEGKVRR